MSLVNESEEYYADPTEFEKFLVSMKWGLHALFNGKKWLIYISLFILPLFFGILADDLLLGNSNARNAFIGYVTGVDEGDMGILLLFFTFGCLLFALPLTADEITDHTLDLFFVRPIRRETLFISRWVVLNVCIFVVNVVLTIFFYFLFFWIDDYKTFFEEAFLREHLALLFNSFILIFALTLIYAGIFLTIGFIGRRGLALGIFAAVFELFIVSLIFLDDSPYIPRTNIFMIADGLFSRQDFSYTSSTKVIWDIGLNIYYDVNIAWLYVFIVPILTIILGLAYLRNRELV